MTRRSSRRSAAFARARPSVLVIDADEEGRRLLARILEKLGCVPVLAESAVRARALCEARPRFALVILDPTVEDGDGVALVSVLRTVLGNRPPPFAIFSTGDPPRRFPEGVVVMLRKRTGLTTLSGVVRDVVVAAHRRDVALRGRSALRDTTGAHIEATEPLSPTSAAEPVLARPGALAATTSRTRARPRGGVEEHVLDDRRDRRRER